MEIQNLIKDFNESGDLHKFVENVSGISWGVCDWGSCQYATAKAMYETLMNLKDCGFDPTKVVGWGPLSELCEKKAPKYVNISLKMLVSDLAKEAYEYAEDCRSWLERMRENLSEIQIESKKKYIKRQMEEAETFKTLSDMDSVFEAMRNNAWDLWTAASVVSSIFFGTDFSGKKDIKSYGVGPVLNQLGQSENYATGLQCFMLVHHGIVKNPDQSFSGFDT